MSKQTIKYQVCIVMDFDAQEGPNLWGAMGRLSVDSKPLKWRFLSGHYFHDVLSAREHTAVLAPFILLRFLPLMRPSDGLQELRLRKDDFPASRHHDIAEAVERIGKVLDTLSANARAKIPKQDSPYTRLKLFCGPDLSDVKNRTAGRSIGNSILHEVARPAQVDNRTVGFRLQFTGICTKDDVVVCRLSRLRQHFGISTDEQLAEALQRIDKWSDFAELDLAGDQNSSGQAGRRREIDLSLLKSVLRLGHPTGVEYSPRDEQAAELSRVAVTKLDIVSDDKPATSSDLGPYAERILDFRSQYLESNVPFCGRNNDIEALTKWLDSDSTSPYLLICEPAGRGKSALLVQWTEQVKANRKKDFVVLFFPLSLRLGLNRRHDLFRFLVEHLARLHNEVPENRDERDFIRRCLGMPLNNGLRLLLVIDGLDEAADNSPDDGPIWTNLLLSKCCNHLRILVSAREQADCDWERWRQRLGWEGTGIVDRLPVGKLTKGDVQKILDEMGVVRADYSGSIDVLERILELSEGEPFVVLEYAKDMCPGKDGTSPRIKPEELGGMTPGLDAFMTRWWQDQKKLMGQRAREADVVNVLNTMACSLGPISSEDLSSVLRCKGIQLTGAHIKIAIEAFSRFVLLDRQSGRYTFSHSLVRDFFYLSEEWGLSDADREEWESAYLQFGMEQVTGLNEGQSDPGRASRYIVERYGAHLDRSKASVEAMSGLLTKAWADAWEHIDHSYLGFLADVDRVWEAASKTNHERAKAGEAVLPHIGTEVRCALLLSSMGTLSSRVHPDLIRPLLETGIWTPRDATSHASRIRNRLARFWAYLEILETCQQRTVQEEEDIVRDAMASASDCRHPITVAWWHLAIHDVTSREDLKNELLQKVANEARVLDRQPSLETWVEEAEDNSSQWIPLLCAGGASASAFKHHQVLTQSNSKIEMEYVKRLMNKNESWTEGWSEYNGTGDDIVTYWEQCLILLAVAERAREPSFRQVIIHRVKEILILIPELIAFPRGYIAAKLADLSMKDSEEDEWRKAANLAARGLNDCGEKCILLTALAKQAAAGEQKALLCNVSSMFVRIWQRRKEARAARQRESHRQNSDTDYGYDAMLHDVLPMLCHAGFAATAIDAWRQVSPRISEPDILWSLALALAHRGEVNSVQEVVDACRMLPDWKADILTRIADSLTPGTTKGVLTSLARKTMGMVAKTKEGHALFLTTNARLSEDEDIRKQFLSEALAHYNTMGTDRSAAEECLWAAVRNLGDASNLRRLIDNISSILGENNSFRRIVELVIQLRVTDTSDGAAWDNMIDRVHNPKIRIGACRMLANDSISAELRTMAITKAKCLLHEAERIGRVDCRHDVADMLAKYNRLEDLWRMAEQANLSSLAKGSILEIISKHSKDTNDKLKATVTILGLAERALELKEKIALGGMASRAARQTGELDALRKMTDDMPLSTGPGDWAKAIRFAIVDTSENKKTTLDRYVLSGTARLSATDIISLLIMVAEASENEMVRLDLLRHAENAAISAKHKAQHAVAFVQKARKRLLSADKDNDAACEVLVTRARQNWMELYHRVEAPSEAGYSARLLSPSTSAKDHALLTMLLHRAATEWRGCALSIVQEIMPLLHGVGHERALMETGNAIVDVCTWWP